MAIERLLRAVPEMEQFSPQQREDLLLSFAPSRLRLKTLRSSLFRSVIITYCAGLSASYFLPKLTTGLIMLGLILIITPIAYLIIARQIRDEFRTLLQYLLTGKVLPACARCGYDLTGLDSFQCPECGADVKWKPPQ